MFKRQKIPARKRVRCFSLASPHICHKTEEKAEKERLKLANRFKGSEFEVFECPFCKKYHVGKVPPEDEFDDD